MEQLNQINKKSLSDLIETKIATPIYRILNLVSKSCSGELEKIQCDSDFLNSHMKTKRIEKLEAIKIPYLRVKFCFVLLYIFLVSVISFSAYYVFCFDLVIYKNLHTLNNAKSQVLLDMSNIHKQISFLAVAKILDTKFDNPDLDINGILDSLRNNNFDAYTQNSSQLNYSDEIDTLFNQESTFDLCTLTSLIEYALISSKCQQLVGKSTDGFRLFSDKEFNDIYEGIKFRKDKNNDVQLLKTARQSLMGTNQSRTYYTSPQSLLTDIKGQLLTSLQILTSGLGAKILQLPVFGSLMLNMVHTSQYLEYLSNFHDLFIVS